MKYNSVGVVFTWVLLTLACYRLQRIVTADSWYFTQAFREWLEKKSAPAHKAGKQTVWTEATELFSCPYCFGWWTCIVVFALTAQVISIPLPAIQAIAASGVVGFVGVWDSRD